MKLTTVAVVVCTFAVEIFAAPTVEKRAVNDGTILNYALTLEHLEDTFYRGALAKFSAADFANAGYYDFYYANLKEISFDESTHVKFLTGALQAAGVTPVQQCTYKFPYTDVQSFIALANVLEGVGVTAYLGAAPFISNGDYLTYAGSVLTIEARHSSFLRRSKNFLSPFPQPFDVPLDFREVISLAGQFIVSCPPSSPALPFKPFPVLARAQTMPAKVAQGSSVPLTSKANLQSMYGTYGALHAYFITVTGPIEVPLTITGPYTASIKVPTGDQVAGQSYVVITKSAGVSDSTIVAGPAVIEIANTYLNGIP